MPIETAKDAPVMGIDGGIAHLITTATGQRYGTFNGKLAERHQQDRAQRRRKAKRRACLQQHGVTRLPSTRTKQLARTVRPAINRAVNQLYREHPAAQCADEHVHVAGMKFQAPRMHA